MDPLSVPERTEKRTHPMHLKFPTSTAVYLEWRRWKYKSHLRQNIQIISLSLTNDWNRGIFMTMMIKICRQSARIDT